MRQGESYPILITDSGVDMDRVTSIEFIIGPFTKTYPGTVTYDSSEKVFSFPISQAESMQLLGVQTCEARLKYSDGQVEGMTIGKLDVKPSTAKVVI